MLKLYCSLALVLGFLCFFSQTIAQQNIDLNSTCSEYYEEIQRLRELHIQSGYNGSNFNLSRVNPAHYFLEPVMQTLDEDARERISGPLAEWVWYNCLNNLRESGLTSDSTVAASLTLALESLELDTQKPRWGLTDLPRIDFDTMNLDDLNNAVSNLPPNWLQNPVNNVVAAAFSRYLRRFDLSSPAAEAKVQRLYTGISFLGGSAAANKTISELLDEQAIELGLKFRETEN